MAYSIEIKYTPVYEFLLSFRAYADKGAQKVLDMGPAWFKQVSATMPAGFRDLTKDMEKMGIPFDMVAQCPAPEDPGAFLNWLAGLSLGELYERLLAAVGDPAKLPPDLGAQQGRFVKALSIWHEHYYRHLDPRIPAGLAWQAKLAQQVVAELPPEAALEQITGGIVLEEAEHVVLLPQYHGRPFNMFDWHGARCIIGYPADPLPPEPGAIPPDLRSLARALADDSRLHILRFLAGGVRSFTDVVRQAGLAKSTVHHHMVILRTSGLIRVHVRPDGADRYSLRADAIDRIPERLHAFLKEEQPHVSL